MKRIKNQLLTSAVFFSFFLTALANQDEPPQIGNFALPTAQQPGPFVSMGQNIVEAKTTQLYLLLNDLVGDNQQFIDLAPSFLHGITDVFSVYLTIPFAAHYTQDDSHSSGIEDSILQFEYAFNVNSTRCYTEQSTILANVTFASGSTVKEPSTGIGAPSFLLGATYNRTYTDWYGFVSGGFSLTTSHDNTKCGDKLFYQMGLGRNLKSIKDEWIFSALLELTGQDTGKDCIQGAKNYDSGGNVVALTPSLWLSTQKLILQLGVGIPIIQKLNGEQHKNHYALIANLGWTFT